MTFIDIFWWIMHFQCQNVCITISWYTAVQEDLGTTAVLFQPLAGIDFDLCSYCRSAAVVSNLSFWKSLLIYFRSWLQTSELTFRSLSSPLFCIHHHHYHHSTDAAEVHSSDPLWPQSSAVFHSCLIASGVSSSTCWVSEWCGCPGAVDQWMSGQ